MKRHRIADGLWIEDPDGEWVKYEDVLKTNDKAFSEGRESAQREPPVECNCEIQADLRKTRGPIEYKPISNDWICPAHGYKRL